MTDGAALKTYIHPPASGGAPRSLVILLHGLGADGRDLIGLGEAFASGLPDTVFVAPDAPEPCDMAPFGYQWFSLQDRSPAAMLAGAQRAVPVLDGFIAAQMERFGVPAARTALLGFSQGTMMSLYAAPRFPEKLAGVLGYSGALLGGDELGAEGIQKMPVCLIHGDADDIVPVAARHLAQAELEAAGFTVSGGVTPGLAHGIDPAGVRDGAAFLAAVLGADG